MINKSKSKNMLRADGDSWDFHLKYVESIDNLSEVDKARIINSLTRLKQLFGDDWLRQAKNEHHPIVAYIGNRILWSQLWLAEFGEKLDALSGFAKFDRLVQQLRSSKQYIAAEAELEAAVKLVKEGITDIELYPEVLVKGKLKKADLKAVVDGEDIYFEVTTLRESKESVDAMETFHSLTNILLDRDTLHQLLPFCQIHKILSKPRIEEFKKKIKKAIDEVKQTQEYAYIGEQGVLDCLIIHRTKQEQGDMLVKQFGMKKEISGPSVDSDDIRRLKHKISEESWQLPENNPGIIVVFGHLYYLGSPEPFYENLVYQLEDTIYNIDKAILAVIISHFNVLEPENKVVNQPHYILVRKSNDAMQESIIIIKNRYSKFPINKKVLSVFTG